MNKKTIFLAIVATLVIMPVLVLGATFKTGESYFMDSGSIINDNLYVAGGMVGVAGTVNGDVMAVGGNVSVSGSVAGDVAVAGGNLNVSANVSGDIRAAGGSVVISNTAGGDLIVAGGQVSVLPGTTFGKDVKIAGGTVTFSGNANKSLNIKAGTVYINGLVAGDLVVTAEDVRLGPNASISGNFDYSSRKNAVLEQGAVVAGKTNFTKIDEFVKNKDVSKTLFLGFIGMAWIVKTMMLLVACLVIFYFFKLQTKDVLNRSVSTFWKEVLRGFIVLIALPIAVILSFMTVVGMFVGLIALFFYIVFVILASVISILLFAKLCLKYLFKKADYELNWWVIIIFGFVFGLITMIPFVGWIFTFIIFLASLGSTSAVVYNRLAR